MASVVISGLYIRADQKHHQRMCVSKQNLNFAPSFIGGERRTAAAHREKKLYSVYTAFEAYFQLEKNRFRFLERRSEGEIGYRDSSASNNDAKNIKLVFGK